MTTDPYDTFLVGKLADVETILDELRPIVNGPNPPAGAFDAFCAAQDAQAHWTKLRRANARNV